MADNETSYLPIGTCLEQIEKAVYGREVRKAIHDGIAQCYDDTVEGVNAAQQAASDTQEVIDNAVIATREANTAAAEASNVKVEQTVSGDTVTFTTTKRDGTTVSTSFQRPNVVVSKDEGSGEFSVTATGWNGEEITAKIPDPSEEVKSRATIAAVSKVKTALGNPLTITDGMDAPAVKTVVTLEPKQDLHGYDHPWVGGSGKNLIPSAIANSTRRGITCTRNDDGTIVLNGTSTELIDFYPTHESGVSVGKSGGFVVPAGTYSFGSVTGGSSTTYRVYLVKWIGSGTTATYSSSTNGEATVTLSEETTIDLFIRVESGVTLNNLVISPMVRLSSTESGYAPYSNICPIEGYDTVRVTATGKNLLNSSFCIDRTANGIKTTRNTDGSIKIQGTWNSNRYWNPSDTLGLTLPAGIYTLTEHVYLEKHGGGSVKGTFTLSEETSFRNAGFTGYTGEVNETIYPQLERGSNTTSYEPFGSATSLSVAQAAGATVYGGTVTLNEDGSGTLVVDRACVNASTLTWIKSALNNCFVASDGFPNELEVHASHHIFSGETSYGYTKLSYDGVNSSSTDRAISWRSPGSSASQKGILIRDSNLSSIYADFNLTNFKTAVSDLEILIPITPTTHQLTATQLQTLIGTNHIWTDGTKLELTYRADKYADVEKFLNTIPTGTKTGDPAVFADGADDLPFEKLTIAVEPHQEGSGDPSPDNIRPITGWDEVKVTRCGKNLFPGIIAKRTLDDTTGEETTTTSNSITTYIPAVYNKVYVLTPATGTATGAVRIFEYDKNLSFLGCSQVPSFSNNSRLIINPANANTRYIRLRAGSGVLVPDVAYQLEEGSNPTAYEPYTSTTLPVSLKYATGSTVYGGTVTINRDGTGSVVVDRAVTTLADKTFSDKQTSSLAAGGFVGVSGFINWIDTSTVVKSDMLVGTTFANRGADGVISPLSTAASVHALAIFTTKTKDEAVAAYKNATICYKLATPIIYTLTAPQLTSLLGNNTIWCDAGQVTVKYKRDIGKALDAMVASLIEAGLYVDMGGVDVVPGA